MNSPAKPSLIGLSKLYHLSCAQVCKIENWLEPGILLESLYLVERALPAVFINSDIAVLNRHSFVQCLNFVCMI